MAIDVLMPPLGGTTDTVILSNWYKKEGDPVKKGEPLFTIETDKASLDIEASDSGILRSVSAKIGDEVKVLTPIAVIAQLGEVLAGAPPPVSTQAAPAAQASPLPAGPARSGERIFVSPRARLLAEQKKVPLENVHPTGPEGAIVERDIRAYLERLTEPASGSLSPQPLQGKGEAAAITPVARRMAEEAGLDWTTIGPGSGARGRVMRKDIEQGLAGAEPKTPLPAAAQTTGEPVEIIPMSGLRGVIAGRMSQSHLQTAPVTLTTEVDATALVELRRELAKDGIEASYNDLLIVVLARALRDHPRLNASLDGESFKVWGEVHIGLAVDTDRGLLAPVIRHVDGKGLRRIAAESAALIARARAGQCTPDELRGSTFTITNLGMYGIDAFTPIINLPECAVLGVGRIKTQPVMVENTVVGRQMVWLSLTFDHRLVDGGPAARFLQRVAQLIERPHLLIT